MELPAEVDLVVLGSGLAESIVAWCVLDCRCGAGAVQKVICIIVAITRSQQPDASGCLCQSKPVTRTCFKPCSKTPVLRTAGPYCCIEACLTAHVEQCSAAAMRGYSVLILDGKSYYGGAAASFTLDELQAWAARDRSRPDWFVAFEVDQSVCAASVPDSVPNSIPICEMDRVFQEVDLTVNSPALLSQSKEYCFDVIHQVRSWCRSAMSVLSAASPGLCRGEAALYP
jgi:hypothetical protein